MTNPLNKIAGYLPQVELVWLGGLKTMAGRLTFYVGFGNLLMIGAVAYQDSPPLQMIFPNVWAFYVGIGIALGAAAIMEYGLVYPSQLKFTKEQASRNERDPIYAKARRIEQNQKEILTAIDELEGDGSD